MDQNDASTIRLSKTPNSKIGQAIAIAMILIPVGRLAYLSFLNALHGAPHRLPALLLGLMAVTFIAIADYIVITSSLKPSVPDVIEVSPTAFRYLHEGQETCAGWSEIGTAERYWTGQGKYRTETVRMTVAGEIFSLIPDSFNLSSTALIDLMTAARSGQPSALDEWGAAHPPFNTKKQLLLVIVVMALTFLIGHFTIGMP